MQRDQPCPDRSLTWHRSGTERAKALRGTAPPAQAIANPTGRPGEYDRLVPRPGSKADHGLPHQLLSCAHTMASLYADGQLYGRTLPTQSQRSVALHKQSYTYVFSRLQSHTHR